MKYSRAIMQWGPLAATLACLLTYNVDEVNFLDNLINFFEGNYYNLYGVLLFAFFFISIVWIIMVEYQGGVLVSEGQMPAKGLYFISSLRDNILLVQSAKEYNQNSSQVINHYKPHSQTQPQKKNEAGQKPQQEPVKEPSQPQNQTTSISGAYEPCSAQSDKPAATKEREETTTTPKKGENKSENPVKETGNLTNINTGLKGVSRMNNNVEEQMRNKMKKMKDKLASKQGSTTKDN